jgi:cell fate (sporulation/competence/biofilm development) regulator YlbF (YheA/YmcA/DUF963 family)
MIFMACCSSNQTLVLSSETDSSAEQLAGLLARAPEYQEFIRLAQLINLDPDVRRLSAEIRKHQTFYADSAGKPVEALQAELEALPAVQVYRKAEAAARALFHAVDEVISATAGVEFAPNAVQSGCG